MKQSWAFYLFLFAGNLAFALTLGPGSDVPGVFALKELCDEQYPEFKAQNGPAFSEWLSRNRDAVNKAEQSVAFRGNVDKIGLFITRASTKDNLFLGCKNLSIELRKPESDVPRE